MCGIFGILARKTQIPPALLEQATCSLAHRGPDDSGTILLKETQPEPLEIGLGHRRLSILDLSPLGHQPMQDPVTGNWVVFNGEIYNFRELRKELEAAGVEFKSHSDTEVILAAYRVWGESCLTRLGGMFAFALWDAPCKRLLLARDPMGIKPLYYHHSAQTFIFASEVRTLLRTGFVPRKADPTGALSYLAFGSVYEPWTIVEGVKAVPPGHVLTVENGRVDIREYWNPLQPSGNATADPLPAILRDAVLSHLVSDVPVGVFLSGGIDSSALVAVLSHNGVRATTFSLVFQEKEFNEGQYSREVARCFGTDHHEIPVSQRDALAVLPEALCAMDQPTIDGINTYLVSAKTRAAGVKVALTGLGADEMFAGYSNFRRVPKMEALAKRFGRLPRLARRSLSASVALFAGKGDRSRKLAELAQGHDSVVHPYFLVRTLFGAEDREVLVHGCKDSESALEGILRESIAQSSTLDPVNRVSYLESRWYMRNTLLRDSDFMSMAHGLELRVPFLDRTLVEACFRIPGNRKLQGDSPKSLLLASLGVELPREVVNRPKQGFTLPFERWLRGEMRPVVEDALLKGNWDQTALCASAVREVWTRFLAGETSWSRPWSLFVLKRWCEQNL
ncbi:MAG: asparagine synthase (glutamine-hydrolyzing) [Acidobacteriia bacterium]|nr:asparagine synthase (glutamine-hydrolyzing) [Terriglobia bacterium]